jgi:hypothetical protein
VKLVKVNWKQKGGRQNGQFVHHVVPYAIAIRMARGLKKNGVTRIWIGEVLSG